LPDSVRVVGLPGGREGYDFTDYIGDGHTVEGFLGLVGDTPIFESTAAETELEGVVPTMTAAEILCDPAARQPPEVVAENFAWRGRTAVVSAREKAGKSTLFTCVVACVSSNRPWLGCPVEAGDVLWIGPEEHIHDLARRLQSMEADLDRVHIMVPPFSFDDPVGWIRDRVQDIEPILVIIDTLAAVTSGIVTDSGSADSWNGFLIPMTEIARGSGAAFLVAAHSQKRKNEYRDSTAIGANFDVILQMEEGDDNIRRFKKNRARWHVPDFAIRLVDTEYRLVGGEVSLEAQIRTYVGANPGCSQRMVRSDVSGADGAIRAELQRLTREGIIEDQGSGLTRCAYHLTRA